MYIYFQIFQFVYILINIYPIMKSTMKEQVERIKQAEK